MEIFFAFIDSRSCFPLSIDISLFWLRYRKVYHPNREKEQIICQA